MELNLLYIVLIFTLLGGIGIYYTNWKKSPLQKKESWLKYFVYILIFSLLFGCICFAENMFHWICLLIILAGLFELINLQKKIPQKRTFFYGIIFIYIFVCLGFYFFSRSLSKQLLLFTFFTVCLFDAFCQIAGQLLGRKKLCPRISPNKTFEGLLVGLLITVCTCFIIGKILEFNILYSMISGFGICLFSLIGDLSASLVKRNYGVKDFSSALPGQGGFLDRFDSLIVAGAFVYLYNLFIMTT